MLMLVQGAASRSLDCMNESCARNNLTGDNIPLLQGRHKANKRKDHGIHKADMSATDADCVVALNNPCWLSSTTIGPKKAPANS